MQGRNSIILIDFVKFLIILTGVDCRIYSNYREKIPDVADVVDFRGGRRGNVSRSFVGGLVGRIDRGNVHNVRNLRIFRGARRIVDAARPRLGAVAVTGFR